MFGKTHNAAEFFKTQSSNKVNSIRLYFAGIQAGRRPHSFYHQESTYRRLRVCDYSREAARVRKPVGHDGMQDPSEQLSLVKPMSLHIPRRGFTVVGKHALCNIHSTVWTLALCVVLVTHSCQCSDHGNNATRVPREKKAGLSRSRCIWLE